MATGKEVLGKTTLKHEELIHELKMYGYSIKKNSFIVTDVMIKNYANGVRISTEFISDDSRETINKIILGTETTKEQKYDLIKDILNH